MPHTHHQPAPPPPPHPLHTHHHQVAATTASQGMYYDLNSGDYLAMAETAPEPDAPISLSQTADLEALLYSTEGVNWNSMISFENSGNKQGWSSILQGGCMTPAKNAKRRPPPPKNRRGGALW